MSFLKSILCCVVLIVGNSAFAQGYSQQRLVCGSIDPTFSPAVQLKAVPIGFDSAGPSVYTMFIHIHDGGFEMPSDGPFNADGRIAENGSGKLTFQGHRGVLTTLRQSNGALKGNLTLHMLEGETVRIELICELKGL